MNMHSATAEPRVSHLSEMPPAQRRQAGEIRRLRETLFELQCEPEPDASAIDGVMRRLALVRQTQALN